MLKKLLFAPLFVLALTGCNQTTVPNVSPVIGTVIGVLPEQVQQIAVQACGFLPAAETVASLIAAFGGPAIPGIATQIANEICSAVTRPQARRRGVAVVRGVVVRGGFVR